MATTVNIPGRKVVPPCVIDQNETIRQFRAGEGPEPAPEDEPAPYVPLGPGGLRGEEGATVITPNGDKPDSPRLMDWIHHQLGQGLAVVILRTERGTEYHSMRL